MRDDATRDAEYQAALKEAKRLDARREYCIKRDEKEGKPEKEPPIAKEVLDTAVAEFYEDKPSLKASHTKPRPFLNHKPRSKYSRLKVFA